MASLHVAVLFGNEELTRTLLEKEDYDANVYDERLGTPLSIAVLKGYRSIVKLLSENGADHTNEKFTSSLIHPRIDELNLPDTFNTILTKDHLKSSTSNLNDILEPSSHAQRPITDASTSKKELQEENAPGTTSTFGPNKSLGPRAEIKVLFKNGSEWKETPAGETLPVTSDDLGPVNGVHGIYAIVQYLDINDEGDWFTAKVEIQSPKLCSFLSRVLKDYPAANIARSKTTLDPVMQGELDPRFIGLFHRMESYVKLSEEEQDSETVELASLLLKVLEGLWTPCRFLVDESRATGLMPWRQLWTVFRPGDTIISKLDEEGSELAAARIIEVELKAMPWHRPHHYQFTVEVVNWNGCNTGYSNTHYYAIAEFKGLMKLSDLRIYPLSYDPDPAKLEEKLVQRGRKFESLRGYFFKTRENFNITRRIIIDNYAYYRFHEGSVPKYARLCNQSSSNERSSDSESSVEASISSVNGARLMQKERVEDLRPLTNYECLLCVPTMKGFDMQEKKWKDVLVDDVESIIWDDDAFDHLAIHEDTKRLVLAFTKQKQRFEATNFDDFITGKGKSFIMLLCGPPGVGKTLTAESVAERIRAPLYILSAGDLGTNAESVERALKRALEMCELWKAVMLIDEADVFLEARESNSIEHNEIVSVFLRLLEYYTGILFLTTNRMSTIDSAFESRIDLIIPYEDLDEAARCKIWRTFASRLPGGTHELCDIHFNKLQQQKLNGREIKSTFKTALMLASSEEKKLQMDHLETVLRVREKAAGYLRGNSSALEVTTPRRSLRNRLAGHFGRKEESSGS
ncbi:hypothetical protein F4808DRAFT_440382 [Astrocystis sublimbata]|nr:hypothetical protein F4808DRAFT_440382 [Astrocystis sublimbata]